MLSEVLCCLVCCLLLDRFYLPWDHWDHSSMTWTLSNIMAKSRSMCLSRVQKMDTLQPQLFSYHCQFTWAHSVCLLMINAKFMIILELQADAGCLQERITTKHFSKHKNRTKHIAMMADNVVCTSSALSIPSRMIWIDATLSCFTCLLSEGLRLFAELLRFIPRFLRIYFGLPETDNMFSKNKYQPLKQTIVCKYICKWTRNHFDQISVPKLFYHSRDLQQWLSSLPMLFPTLLCL